MKKAVETVTLAADNQNLLNDVDAVITMITTLINNTWSGECTDLQTNLNGEPTQSKEI